jgi:hypothetical protein
MYICFASNVFRPVRPEHANLMNEFILFWFLLTIINKAYDFPIYLAYIYRSSFDQ